MSALAAGAPAPAAALRTPAAVRLAALGALALFAALQWATLEAPGRPGRMVQCALVAAAVAAGAHAAARQRRLARIAVLVVLVAVAVGAVLIAAGVPLRLLAPARWGGLASGLGQGLQSLPGIGVPYQGVDPWVHVVLVAGGGLLIVLGALLGIRALHCGTRPLGAAVVLVTTYAIPVVGHAPRHGYLWGALLTVLLGGLLWGDRLDRAHGPIAGVFVAVALGGALAVSPGLDTGKPWVDYQGIIDSLSTPPAIAFNWNHGYGPLHWPRDNREMLRVAVKTPVYLKATDLDDFNGVGWRVDQTLRPGVDAEITPAHRGWREQLRVTVRDLRSPSYIGAGTALSVEKSPRFAVPSAPGTFATGHDPLQRGDSYLIDVYAPRPSELEMASDSSDYPTFATSSYLSMGLPQSVGGPAPKLTPGTPSTLGPVQVRFEQFGLFGSPSAFDPDTGHVIADGAALLRRSQYAPMYDLALRLREQSSTPYEFIRAVEAHLAAGFVYTEAPPAPRPGRPPLVSFLFDTHEGYCQQFSGAMALLLRMGGVPARVASGFTPGTYDAGRREWVVRDVDAHSWVEAYFPGIGWVTFDPTPAIAPPHDQLANGPAPPDARAKALRPDPRRADVPRRAASAGAPSSHGAPVPVWLIVLGALAASFGAGGAAAAVRTRRRFADVPPELAELHRALRRTGRSPQPGMTLRALEARYARTAPGAAAYVAAVRLARFGGRASEPSPEQRAALRSELAAGLGWGGRLRAWWALPPTGRRPRPVYTPE